MPTTIDLCLIFLITQYAIMISFFRPHISFFETTQNKKSWSAFFDHAYHKSFRRCGLHCSQYIYDHALSFFSTMFVGSTIKMFQIRSVAVWFSPKHSLWVSRTVLLKIICAFSTFLKKFQRKSSKSSPWYKYMIQELWSGVI